MLRFLRFLPSRWWSPAAWKRWWTYIHWRLETYGVYHTDGKFHAKAFISLVHQLRSYEHWLAEFGRIRKEPYKVRDSSIR